MKKYIVLVVLIFTFLVVGNTIAQNNLTDIETKAKTDALWDLDTQKWFQMGI